MPLQCGLLAAKLGAKEVVLTDFEHPLLDSLCKAVGLALFNHVIFMQSKHGSIDDMMTSSTVDVTNLTPAGSHNPTTRWRITSWRVSLASQSWTG